MFKPLFSSFLLLLVTACSPPPSNLCPNNETFTSTYSNQEANFISRRPELHAFNDYEMGLACAQRQNKPIFLVFTGYGSRTHYIPDILLQEPRVLQAINDYFVPIILFVDDRQKLPQPETVEINPGEIITLRNVGNVNALLQKTQFGVQSQPFMAFINWQEEQLATPMGYTPNPDQIVLRLQEAVENFNTKK